MQRVATGAGTDIVGAFTVGAGGLLGCKGKVVFTATGVYQATYFF